MSKDCSTLLGAFLGELAKTLESSIPDVATGVDLDELANMHTGLVRNGGESDSEFRTRITAALRGEEVDDDALFADKVERIVGEFDSE